MAIADVPIKAASTTGQLRLHSATRVICITSFPVSSQNFVWTAPRVQGRSDDRAREEVAASYPAFWCGDCAAGLDGIRGSISYLMRRLLARGHRVHSHAVDAAAR